MKTTTTYTLIVYMKRNKEIMTIKSKFDESQLQVAKALGESYNKRGHDVVIVKETIEPISYIINKNNLSKLKGDNDIVES